MWLQNYPILLSPTGSCLYFWNFWGKMNAVCPEEAAPRRKGSSEFRAKRHLSLPLAATASETELPCVWRRWYVSGFQPAQEMKGLCETHLFQLGSSLSTLNSRNGVSPSYSPIWQKFGGKGKFWISQHVGCTCTQQKTQFPVIWLT